MTTAAPFTGALRIDSLPTPGGGTIGMVHCPGRCAPPWQRDLASDIATIRDWPADVLVSLVEDHEFARLGVPRFAEEVRRSGLVWHHVPIADMQIPGGHFDHAWLAARPVVMNALSGGGRVVLHCAAGLGRTGMIAAKLLMALGVEGGDAVAQVRRARPGTIETAEQERFVRTGRPL